MNAIATTGVEDILSLSVLSKRKVVLFYEDPRSHEHALDIGHQLAAQFGHESSSTFDAWDLHALSELESAFDASHAAAKADIIIFSTHGDDLRLSVRVWLESWMRSRVKPEGILALVVSEPISPAASMAALVPRLHQVALRLGMRFLSYLPGHTTGEAEDKLHEAVPEPEATFEQPHWAHWGLNE
jgi:hypothetical protein